MIDPVSDETVQDMDPFAQAEASAAALRKRAGVDGFDVAVVLGSGWRAAADAIGAAEIEVPLAELGGFKQPSVAGHAPSVRYIKKGQRRVLLYLGRIHLFEGYEPHAVAHGVRTAIAAGCRAVVLTNAAGGINAGYAVGQPVLISDHINLTGRSPLWGPLLRRGSRRGSPTSQRCTPGGCATWRGNSTRHSPRVSTQAFLARTLRRRPRSGCCGPPAPTSWGCRR